MNQIKAVYEAESQTGTPYLRIEEGIVSPADRDQMEDELRKSYKRLSTGHARSWMLCGASFDVEVERRHPRQPTLVLRGHLPVPAARLPVPTDWVTGFLAEVARLPTCPEAAGLPAFELNALRTAVEQLQLQLQATPADWARVLFAAYLRLMENLYQGRGPEYAAMYSLALRGLSRALKDTAAGESAAWQAAARGPLADGTGEQGGGWKTWFFQRLLRLSFGDAATA